MDKYLKKATARTKERLLEGIGKAKATQDEVFDQHAANLAKQAKASERLHKDIKAYCIALKTLCQTEKQLRDTIRETYEPEWPEKEHLGALLDNLDIQTTELEKGMGEDLTQSVNQYVGQFSDLKKKVEKRGRKLVDYDSAKNSYNSLKASSKKVDSDPKVAKALTELQDAEACYKEINGELLEILPAIYDSRITFIVDTLQTMFNAQSVYNGECSKLNKQVVSQLDKLGQSIDYLRVPRLEPRTLTPIDTISQGDSRASTPSPAENAAAPDQQRNSVVSGNMIPQSTPVTLPVPTKSAAETKSTGSGNPFDVEDEEEIVEEVMENKVYPKLNAAPPGKAEEEEKKPVEELKVEKEVGNPFEEDDEEQPIPKEKEITRAPLPLANSRKNILYTVITTHEYKAVDTDELSFGPGEEINVLEPADAEMLDEGWKLGEKANGTKGVFPENFTKKKN